jgi:hypothetical protein
LFFESIDAELERDITLTRRSWFGFLGFFVLLEESIDGVLELIASAVELRGDFVHCLAIPDCLRDRALEIFFGFEIFGCIEDALIRDEERRT